MATAISRVGGDLKIDDGTNAKYIPLDDVNVKVINGTLTISEDRAPKFVTTNPTEVTSPSQATLELLADEIVKLAMTGSIVNPEDIVYGNPLSVVIGSSTTEIVPLNASRVTVVLSNDNTKAVWIAIGKPAEVDKGIILLTQGDKIELPSSRFGTEAINGIKTGGGSADIIFQEYTT